jgi:hypothetical protein
LRDVTSGYQQFHINIRITIKIIMASSTVTPSRRSAGWNVVFLVGKSHSHFAGVFSPASCSLLTFQDVVREMSLCFEFQGGSGGDDTSFWENIAFETLDQDSCHGSFPSLIRDLSISVPSLDSPNLKCPNVLRFRIFRHTPCQLPDDSPFHAHLQGQCNMSAIPVKCLCH